MSATSIFGNGTEHEGRWVSEPTRRGTFGLVSSCVITLSLCVWGCVHLNLPGHHGHTKQIWRKVGWVVVGSLIPEMVVFTAFYQRLKAKEMLKYMMDHCGQKFLEPELFAHRLSRWLARLNFRKKATPSSSEPPSENSPKVTPTHSGSRMTWTLTHGFYATMGGFAIDGSKAERPFLPMGQEYVTFTQAGIKTLIRLGYMDEFGNISVDDIRDKGKASSIAKVLVAIQTLWFCTQLVARLAQSLPISLLELNTFAHGICTLFAIYFWWEKPQDIEQPTLLPLNRTQPLCAFLWMHSKLNENRLAYGKSRAFFENNSFAEAQFWTPMINRGSEESSGKSAGGKYTMAASGLVFEVNSDSCNKVGDLPSTTVQPMPEQAITEQMVSLPSSEPSPPPARPQDRKLSSKLDLSYSPELVIRKGCVVPGTIFALKDAESVSLSQIDITRLSLASKVAEIHPGLFRQSAILMREDTNFLAMRLSELTMHGSFIGVLVVSITAMVYGGLHCIAWSSNSFATNTERLLWRISCLALIAPIPLAIIYQAFYLVSSNILSQAKKYVPSAAVSADRSLLWSERLLSKLVSLRKPLHDIFELCFLLAIFLAFVLVILGRAYLIIECFINVGYLDSRVFLSPSWTNYLPHIG